MVPEADLDAVGLGRALKELAARDATGAHTPLTAEVLARREDRLFETSLGRIDLLNRVGTGREVAPVPRLRTAL